MASCCVFTHLDLRSQPSHSGGEAGLTPDAPHDEAAGTPLHPVEVRNMDMLQANFGHVHLANMVPVHDCRVFCVDPQVVQRGT